MRKTIYQLRPSDFSKYPVWEWDLDNDEESLNSINKYPVSSLKNRIIGTSCTFNNGVKHDCVISNIDLQDNEQTEQFILISVFFRDKYIAKPRYHDVSFEKDMKQFINTFGNIPDDIFPIQFDISRFVSSKSKVKNGIIPIKPLTILSSDELIKLAVG